MAPRRFRLAYEASDFSRPHESLNGNYFLRVEWHELLWAVITVGKAGPHDLSRHGRHSVAEIAHRVACFEAYYAIEGGWLVVSPAFRHLDPSEKGIVSFYTGMAMAKLYAEKVLGIPWLMHISRYQAAWAVSYGANRNRPDLFGCNPDGDWVVAEAKGRSRVTNQLIKKMKQQKSAVETINGDEPIHRLGAASRLMAGRVSLRVVDPPVSRRAQQLTLNPAAWLVDYYSPLVSLLEESNPRQEADLTIGRIPGTNVEIGLGAEVAETVREARERQLQRRPPRRGDRGKRRVDRESLVEQADEVERDIVWRLQGAALRERARGNVAPDGVLINAERR